MISTHRILACTIPIKLAALLAFTWYATRPQVTPDASPIDHIVVTKSTHTMTLYAHGKPIQSYKVALGRSEGRKVQQGDHRSPEGHYLIDSHTRTLRSTYRCTSRTRTRMTRQERWQRTHRPAATS